MPRKSCRRVEMRRCWLKLEKIHGHSLARLFSNSTLTSLAAPESRMMPGRSSDSIAGHHEQLKPCLSEFYDDAFREMSKNYRSEYYYKNTLVSKIIFGRHSPKTASAVLELPIGGSIVDLVVLNGTTTAYEIKSDYDTFARLPNQLEEYRTAFEHIYVVTSEKRVPEALNVCPPDIGVMAIRASGALKVYRKSRGGLGELVPEAMFEILTTREAVKLVRAEYGIEISAAPGDIRRICRSYYGDLPLERAHQSVLNQLRERGMRANFLVTVPAFPHALRAMAYAKQLNAAGMKRVLQRLGCRESPS